MVSMRAVLVMIVAAGALLLMAPVNSDIFAGDATTPQLVYPHYVAMAAAAAHPCIPTSAAATCLTSDYGAITLPHRSSAGSGE